MRGWISGEVLVVHVCIDDCSWCAFISGATLHIIIYIKSFLEYRVIPWCHGLWSGVFGLGLSMRFAELEFSVEYGLVRAPPSGGGSNAPRPAVSVPHIDVNADGCRARGANVEEELFWKNC